MPFDGSRFDHGPLRLFDEMLEFFGPDGERWAQHAQIDDDGRRCLVGALAGCRAKLKMPKRDNAARYLRAAIRGHQGGNRISIMRFNDHEQRTFKDIRDVLLAAGEMARTGDIRLRDDRQLTLPL